MKRAFNIQAIVWHEVKQLIDVDPIHEALNTYLDLSKYGTGIEYISFTYIAVKPENTIHNNDARYISYSKTLELQLKLSYLHIQKAESPQILEMMAALFMVSIDLYAKLDIPDFNTSAFKRDCEHLFESKGWLKSLANR